MKNNPVINRQPGKLPEAVESLLREGQPVRFSALGNSMHPTIKQGDTLIIEPCDPANLSVGDIALYKQDERLFAHRIIQIGALASRTKAPLLKSRHRRDAPKVNRSAKRMGLSFVLRGDFRPNPDPAVTARQILGKIVAIERDSRTISPYGCGKRLFAKTYRLASRFKSHLPI